MPTIQGHRGCRGLLPENTIPAFIKAIEIGCDYIELDITVSGDNQILVSHDAYPSDEFCSHPAITFGEANEKEFNFYKMSYNQISQFDCGLKPHPRFLKQRTVSSSKPLLKDLVQELNKHSTSIIYNIEIKSEAETDGIFHPSPTQYVELLIDELQELDMVDRCVIQSFDIRPLSIIHKKYPGLKLGYIVGYNDFKHNMALINFSPNFYVAHYSLVDKNLVQQVRQNNMEIFVWTVNRVEEMERMLSLNVDSIITDYPDLLIEKIQDIR